MGIPDIVSSVEIVCSSKTISLYGRAMSAMPVKCLVCDLHKSQITGRNIRSPNCTPHDLLEDNRQLWGVGIIQSMQAKLQIILSAMSCLIPSFVARRHS